MIVTMKSAFLQFVRRYGRTWFLLSCLVLDPLMVRGQSATWDSRNVGAFINTAPQIDATNFYNEATWNIGTFSPFETAHTLNYTNIGIMNGSLGWEFDWGPSISGQRSMAANFVNNAGGATITALDGQTINLLDQLVYQSYLWVSATNIINKGTLVAGAHGEIRLTGKNVNLSHSGIEITPLTAIGSANNFTLTNFTSDNGIVTLFWQPTNNYTIFEPIWDGTELFNPLFPNGGFDAVNICGQTSVSIPSFIPTVSDSFSNNTGLFVVHATNNVGQPVPPIFLATNQIRQAVFVVVGDSNTIPAAIHFSPSPIPTNFFDTISVQFFSTFTNVITGQVQTNYIYIVDDYASYTNGAALPDSNGADPSSACNGTPLRPVNFVVSRLDPGNTFAGGATGLGPPSGIFLYDPLTFSNSVISGMASLYGFNVDNKGNDVPPELPAGSSVTNLEGRVRIYADNLNLNQTKVRAEGQIVIQTTNLTSTVNAVMDCQNLSYNLSSATGNLNFTNLAKPIVERLNGNVTVLSTLVTNFVIVITPNWVTNTAGTNGGPWIEQDLTNALQININMLVVDASVLTNTLPVTVQDLVLHDTNILVSDSVNVDNTFLLDGQSATLQGNVTLFGALQNWTTANAPTLRYFTNNGILSIPNSAHFGDDGSTNYLAFVNNGAIESGGQSINAANLQINNGTNVTFGGGFYAVIQTGQLNGALIFSASDIQFTASNLQILQSILSAQAALDFTSPNITDGGISAPNIFICQNGFNLWSTPVKGSLLGTGIDDMALGQSEVDHVWAGKNLGAGASGFINNAAINTLILDPQGSQAVGYDPLFAFSGATGNNGMYVSNLDLSLLTDYANEIEIDPSLTIYFATAELNPSVVIAPFPDAEHFLNGQFGGHLQWIGVTSFSKPQSAFAKKFQLTAGFNNAAGQFQLVENVMPGQTNITEASTNLLNWVPICTNIGSYSNFGLFTIMDTNSRTYNSRFYRFKVLP